MEGKDLGQEKTDLAGCSGTKRARMEPQPLPEEQSSSGGSKTIEDLPDEVLVEVLARLRLEDIVLRVRHVSERWRALSEDSRVFRDLRYTPPLDATEEDIINMLQLAPKLRWPSMHWSYFTRGVVQTLCRSCRDIRSIHFNRRTVKMLPAAVDMYPNVEELGLNLMYINSTELLAPLSRWRHLKTLKLGWWPPVKGVFSVVAKCPPLKEFYLLGCFLLCSIYPCAQNEFSALQRISLERCFDKNCQCQFPELKQYCTRIRERFPRCRLPRCRWVESPENLFKFFTSPAALSLQKLDIHCQNIDEQLAATIFINCKQLKYLSLENVDIVDNSLCWIHKLENLQHLRLFSEDLTDTGVKYITCSSLRHLRLRCDKLTGESFVHCLHTLPYLQVLDMGNTKVSSALLLKVPDCLKHLKRLSVVGDNLEETILIIKRHLPDLKFDISGLSELEV